ncbi:MAG: glycosyltransferase family 4 protein [Acidimicrobiales bacterium]|jgi:glycosyltransferase involved in cell wall biosynthesis|nr:glycosyltransferase family 4 protein [Acidimicrobiales bacterium]
MQERLRIGIVAPPWFPVPPDAYGGTENVIHALVTGLSAAGHEVVLCAHPDSDCPGAALVPTAPVPAGTSLGSAGYEAEHVLRAYDALRGRVDVVHDHTVLGPLLAPASPGVPVVTTVHGPFARPIGDLAIAAARRCALVAISAAQAAHARCPVAAVIHHGVDPCRFPVGPGGGPLVFLGRFAPEKGAAEAIDAARRVGVPIVLAAKMHEPSEQQYFERAIRPRLGAGARYLGEVTFARKVALLGTARALLSPIRWEEPFGMNMIESLACGTPVIAHDRGSVPEIVEQGTTGWITHDEDGLVDAIDRVAELDRRRCRHAVETRFSAQRMVADHVRLYRSLLSASGSGCGSRSVGVRPRAGDREELR